MGGMPGLNSICARRLCDDVQTSVGAQNPAAEKQAGVAALDDERKLGGKEAAVKTPAGEGASKKAEEGPKKAEGVGAGAGAKQRKNVVMIMTDDLRPSLGAYGVPAVITPNFDRLAAVSTT